MNNNKIPIKLFLPIGAIILVFILLPNFFIEGILLFMGLQIFKKLRPELFQKYFQECKNIFTLQHRTKDTTVVLNSNVDNNELQPNSPLLHAVALSNASVTSAPDNSTQLPKKQITKLVKNNNTDTNQSQFMKKISFSIIGIALVGYVLYRSIIVIEAGEVGVYSLFGNVRDTEFNSGMHIVNPLATITRFGIQTEQYTMSVAVTEGTIRGGDEILALTKEGLEVDIDVTVMYRVNVDDAALLYKTVGLDYANKIVRPEIRGVIRDVIAEYEAKDLYSEKRPEVTLKIESKLSERFKSRGIIVEGIQIRNIGLPESVLTAIQKKLTAEQESLRYDFLLETERKEAERKRIAAEGQRDSQKIINESLSPEYLNYLYVNELKEREGTIYVPVSPSSGMPVFKSI